MIVKLAAASAAAYGLYRLITQRNAEKDAAETRFQPAGSLAPATATPAGSRGPYVSPV